MTYLAKTAIEQRIGFRLEDINQPMTLVDAPANWAPALCTMTGINYYAHWSGFDGEVPTGLETVADYVQRLRLFLDSYLLDYPFANGNDVAVLSLRRDLLGTRQYCSVEGHNLLRSTESLAGPVVAWTRACPAGAVCPVLEAVSASPFLVRPLEADAMGVVTRSERELGGGNAAQMTLVCDGVTAMNCGGSGLGGSLAQSIELGSGSYVASWYERVWEDGGPPSGTCLARTPMPTTPRMAVAVELDPGSSAVVTVGAPGYLDPTLDRWVDPCEWRRVSAALTIETPESEPIQLDFSLADAGATWNTDLLAHTLTIAGLQLERVPEDVSAAPAPYFPTDEDGRAPVGLCDDADGSQLRSLFSRRCENYCAVGSGDACASSDESVGRCFYELEFDVSLLDIERGHLIPTGSFAYGNFNYRVDQLAMNVVGTGVRDCTEVADPSACYASGFIPYSLRHEGPYRIRNHNGENFDLSIMTGQIQFAKSLAAERYLTNPLSSTDRSLLSDYWRTEFRGRPLNGHYTIRIHETPGFRWDSVEDVQVLLNYRYWTRQE
jgi:hypothetical protein